LTIVRRPPYAVAQPTSALVIRIASGRPQHQQFWERLPMSADASPPDLSVSHDFTGDTFTPIYISNVRLSGGSAGHGRASGQAVSHDGQLNVELRVPAEMGGPGGGTNPEQLFAAGYAACFHGALSLLAREDGVDPSQVSIDASVAFGRDPADGGYLLTADLVVRWPGVDAETAQGLVDRADLLCPYSKMTRQGTPSTVRLDTTA
jgi:lipoyl-dependent peroxiredoxin